MSCLVALCLPVSPQMQPDTWPGDDTLRNHALVPVSTYQSLNCVGSAGLLTICYPDSVLLNLARLRDSVFQHCHSIPNVISRSLNVVGRRGADVRMPQNPLNQYIRHSQAV
jgi:hypothetical protein